MSRIFANKAAEEMGHVHGMLRKPMQHPQEKTSKSKYKLIIPWKGCRIKEVHGLFEATCAGSLKPLKASCLKPASPASSPEEVSLSELKDAVDAASKRGKAKGSKRKDEAHHGPPWPTWSTKDSC